MHLPPTSLLDLGLLIAGFGMGISTKLRLPFMMTMFLIKVIKWYIDTHPHGKEMAAKTDLDEQFRKIFHLEIKKIEEHDKVEAKVDNNHNSLS